MRPILFQFKCTLFLLPVLFFSSCSEKDTSNTLIVTGSSTVAPVVIDAALRYENEHPGVRIGVQTGGSSRGITDARNGLADLGMASRKLKADESDIIAETIAIDGVCMIVHRDNPVVDLTKGQIAAIYQKEIVNWNNAGGNDVPIVVASKAEGRATLEVFLNYVGIDSADVQADVIVGENQHAIKTVAGNPNAIAYVSIGAAASETEAGTPVKLISIDGVDPTPSNVASGIFPITRPLNIIAKGEPHGLKSDFLQFLKSDSINDIIETHLYVPIKK